MIWKFSEGVQNIMWVSIRHLIKLSSPQIILQTSSWHTLKTHLESSPHKTFQPMDYSTKKSSHIWKIHLEASPHKSYQTRVYLTALSSGNDSKYPQSNLNYHTSCYSFNYPLSISFLNKNFKPTDDSTTCKTPLES
jgi:hypothetical protein